MYAVQVSHAGNYAVKETVYETDDRRLARDYARGVLDKSAPYTLVSVFDYDTNSNWQNWYAGIQTGELY